MARLVVVLRLRNKFLDGACLILLQNVPITGALPLCSKHVDFFDRQPCMAMLSHSIPVCQRPHKPMLAEWTSEILSLSQAQIQDDTYSAPQSVTADTSEVRTDETRPAGRSSPFVAPDSK